MIMSSWDAIGIPLQAKEVPEDGWLSLSTGCSWHRARCAFLALTSDNISLLQGTGALSFYSQQLLVREMQTNAPTQSCRRAKTHRYIFIELKMDPERKICYCWNLFGLLTKLPRELHLTSIWLYIRKGEFTIADQPPFKLVEVKQLIQIRNSALAACSLRRLRAVHRHPFQKVVSLH